MLYVGKVGRAFKAHHLPIAHGKAISVWTSLTGDGILHTRYGAFCNVCTSTDASRKRMYCALLIILQVSQFSQVSIIHNLQVHVSHIAEFTAARKTQTSWRVTHCKLTSEPTSSTYLAQSTRIAYRNTLQWLIISQLWTYRRPAIEAVTKVQQFGKMCCTSTKSWCKGCLLKSVCSDTCDVTLKASQIIKGCLQWQWKEFISNWPC